MGFTTIIFRNVMRRKTRSLLTMLGVALAIAAVVALLGITSGFSQSLLTMYEDRGVDLVVVRAGVADRLTSTLDESIGERIKKLPHVKAAAASLTELDVMPIRGWQPDSFAFEQLHMASGRRLTAEDAGKVLLGVTLAAEKNKKVGDKFEISAKDFEVVGIFDVKNPIENSAAVMLLPDLQSLMDRTGQVTEFQIAMETIVGDGKTAAVEELRREIEALTDAEGKSLRLTAMPTHDFVSSNTQLRLAQGMAWMTSMIALVIGGVGILNTMIMSVLERTQEIGVLRALGWRKFRIIRLILGESMLLTLGGAVAGSLLAVVLTFALTQFSLVPGMVHGDFSPRVLLIGLAMAIGVGLFGGLYPAWRGATLPPTEALRYE